MQVPHRPSEVEFGVGIDLPSRKDPRIGDEANIDALGACVDDFSRVTPTSLGASSSAGSRAIGAGSPASTRRRPTTSSSTAWRRSSRRRRCITAP